MSAVSSLCASTFRTWSRPSRVAVLTAALLAPALASAVELNLGRLHTERLNLVYPQATMSYVAPYAAQCVANSLEFQRRVFDFRPAETPTIVLTDLSDHGNASASVTPHDLVLVQMAPLSFAYETNVANERLNFLMTHELVHVALMDKAAARDRAFRRLFGGKVVPIPEHPESILYFYLTMPRVAAPGWYQEGAAVFMETWMTGGRGRAQGAWDEMVFRSMVRDEAPFYSPVGLVSEATLTDFQVGANEYLYGTRFLSYLALRYGPAKLVAWFSRTDGSAAYYATQFERTFGMTIAAAWKEWVAWEHGFQKRNLEALRVFPITPTRDLTERALGSVSRAFYDRERREIYAALNYPGTVAYLGAISVEDGSIRRIVDIKGPMLFKVTSLAWDPQARKLFYTTDNLEHRDLRVVDPETGESRTLLEDARIGSLVVNPRDRSIWGIRNLNGIVSLVRIPHPYREWERVVSLPYGEVLYSLDISPDGGLLVAGFGQIDGSQSLRVMRIEDLSAGRLEPIHRLDFGRTVPMNFVFAPDGETLYGSSYYTGVANLFRYRLGDEKPVPVTNTETGLFRPIPLEDGSLIAFRYSGDGFVPVMIEDPEVVEDANPIVFLGQRIAARYPLVREWNVGSPAEIPIESRIESQGPYAPISDLHLESIYPVVEGYKDSPAVGLVTTFSDPIGINRFRFTASYSPDEELPSDERLHLALDYRRYDWHLRLKWNDADFYDLFGPTKRARKGYSIGIGYTRPLILDLPRRLDVGFDTAYYGDLDRLPDFQNVEAPADRLWQTEIRLDYEDVRSSLGHVDDEKGWRWHLAGHYDQIPENGVASLSGGLDLGWALPLPHSSIWWRNSGGVAFGERTDPLAKFYLGGFGNNWVDHLEVKRYRQDYSFPGVEINEIAGRTYLRSMLEWNLPPIHFASAGTPGFYLSWARPAFFVSGVRTNLDDGAALEREVGDVGFQVDLRMRALARLDLTLSLGYAVAVEEGRGPRDEVMVSLKVL